MVVQPVEWVVRALLQQHGPTAISQPYHHRVPGRPRVRLHQPSLTGTAHSTVLPRERRVELRLVVRLERLDSVRQHADPIAVVVLLCLLRRQLWGPSSCLRLPQHRLLPRERRVELWLVVRLERPRMWRKSNSVADIVLLCFLWRQLRQQGCCH